jgi:hypothetical protein
VKTIKSDPGRDRRLLDGFVRISRLSEGGERHPPRGGEVIFEQPAKCPAIAGPCKYHEANDFGVGGGGFSATHHQHRQRDVTHRHGR